MKIILRAFLFLTFTTFVCRTHAEDAGSAAAKPGAAAPAPAAPAVKGPAAEPKPGAGAGGSATKAETESAVAPDAGSFTFAEGNNVLRARIPILDRMNRPDFPVGEDFQPAAVQSGTEDRPDLAAAWTLKWEPAAEANPDLFHGFLKLLNSPPVRGILTITAPIDKTPPGSYKVVLHVPTTAIKKWEPYVFNLYRPAAKLKVWSGSILLEQELYPFGFRTRSTEISVPVKEPTKRMDLRGLKVIDVPEPPVREREECKLLVSPPAEVLTGGTGSSVDVKIRGDFPVGSHKGTLQLELPEYGPEALASIQYEIKTTRARGPYIALLVILAAILGVIVRVVLERYRDHAEALGEASEVVAACRETLKIKDAVFRKTVDAAYGALVTAAKNFKLWKPSEELRTAITTARTKLESAKTELGPRLTAFVETVNIWQNALSPSRTLPASLLAAVRDASKPLKDIAALLEQSNISAAQSAFNNKVSGAFSQLQEDAKLWLSLCDKRLTDLKEHPPTLSAEDVKDLREAISYCRNLALTSAAPGPAPAPPPVAAPPAPAPAAAAAAGGGKPPAQPAAAVTVAGDSTLPASVTELLNRISRCYHFISEEIGIVLLKNRGDAFVNQARSLLDPPDGFASLTELIDKDAAAAVAQFDPVHMTPNNALKRQSGQATHWKKSLSVLIHDAKAVPELEKALAIPDFEEAVRITQKHMDPVKVLTMKIPGAMKTFSPPPLGFAARVGPQAEGQDMTASVSFVPALTGSLEERAGFVRKALVARVIQSAVLAVILIVVIYAWYEDTWTGKGSQLAMVFVGAFSIDLSTDALLKFVTEAGQTVVALWKKLRGVL